MPRSLQLRYEFAYTPATKSVFPELDKLMGLNLKIRSVVLFLEEAVPEKWIVRALEFNREEGESYSFETLYTLTPEQVELFTETSHM